MTVRGEIAQSPSETGAWSREGGKAYLKQYVDRPNGEPACLDAGANHVQVRRHRACEIERPLHDRGAKKDFYNGF